LHNGPIKSVTVQNITRNYVAATLGKTLLQGHAKDLNANCDQYK